MKLTLVMRQIVPVLLLLSPKTRAQTLNENHWEDYEPRTIQSVIEIHRNSDVFKDMKSKKKAMLLTGDNFPSQVKLIYLGQKRPISGYRKVLLDAWRKMLRDKAPPDDVFVTEVLFKEGRSERWLAIQEPLLGPLTKEVKQGDTVNAYVIWVGAIKGSQKWEWLFAMNEFVACPPSRTDCTF